MIIISAPSPNQALANDSALTPARLREREAYARRHGVGLLDVLAFADCMHMVRITQALGPTATLGDATRTHLDVDSVTSR